MPISSYDVAFLVDHESSLVNINVLALFIFAKKELDITIVVPVENPHDLLQLKGFPVIVEKLGHKATKWLELAIVKAFNSILVYHASLFVD